MIWGGYDTWAGMVLAPGFPSSKLQLVQGLRLFLPLLAGWLALLIMLSQHRLDARAVGGPLGFLAFFGMVAAVSSALLSPHPIHAVCWACEFGAVILVLLTASSGPDAFSTVSRLMTLNWFIDIGILIGLLAAIPLLGRGVFAPTSGSPLGEIAFHGKVGVGNGTIVGMTSTRSTGFARYAGVAGIVALARLWQGKWRTRLVWAGILLAVLYALLLAQARTETIAFIAGCLVILVLRRVRRIVILGMGILWVAFLALIGFFGSLWKFGTRGHGFDPTLTGRTYIWAKVLKVAWRSPWIGFGYRADRYFHCGDAQNTLIHALIESGVLGTIAFASALGLAWFFVIRFLVSRQSGKLPDEVPGVLAFFTVYSITESFAYYSAGFLLLAPVLAYIQAFAWQQKALAAKPAYARQQAVSLDSRAVARWRIDPEKGPAFTGSPCQTDG